MEQRKRRLPHLKSLLFLESVVRTGSVTAAADELSITHSAVSKQLSQLEKWLGMPLFVEKRKGMIATAEIGRLAVALSSAFDEIQDALDELRPSRIQPSLRVIAPATLAMRWLIPKLPDFHRAERPIDTMVRPTHTPDNWLDMPFDVAIRRGGIIPPPFEPQHLFAEKLSLVVSSRLVRDDMGKMTEAGLAEIGLLDVITRPGELKTWLKAAGLSASLGRRTLKLPHFYIALDAMLAGQGALVVPTFLIDDHLLRREVVEPFPGCVVEGPGYQIFANPASTEGEAAAGFIDWIKVSTPEERIGNGETHPRRESRMGHPA